MLQHGIEDDLAGMCITGFCGGTVHDADENNTGLLMRGSRCFIQRSSRVSARFIQGELEFRQLA